MILKEYTINYDKEIKYKEVIKLCVELKAETRPYCLYLPSCNLQGSSRAHYVLSP